MVLCCYNLKLDRHSAFCSKEGCCLLILLSASSLSLLSGGENRTLFFECWKDSRMCKSFFRVALVNTQMWPLTLKQALYFTGLVGVMRGGKSRV